MKRRPWHTAWFAPLVALLAVCLVFVTLKPDTFARADNLITMLRQTVVVGVASLGMTLIIVHGGIDLSVGSAVALATVVAASTLKAGHGPVAACVAAIGACATAGAVVGLLVTKLRLTPFIVTLGAMSILRGLAKGVAHEQKIDADPRGLDVLLAPGEGILAALPPGVWLAIALALGTAGLLGSTRFGRHVYAVGSSEATARLAGVAVERVRLAVYTLAGVLVGIAGVLEFSTLTVGDPTDAAGLELEVIASVVIGGASLSGGEGSVAGSLVGAFLMTVIRTGGTHMGLPNWVQEIVTGVIIAAAVAVDRVRRRRR